MAEGPSRRGIMKASKELKSSGRDGDFTISVSPDMWKEIRREAGLDPSHPGEEWTESHAREFWDRRLP